MMLLVRQDRRGLKARQSGVFGAGDNHYEINSLMTWAGSTPVSR